MIWLVIFVIYMGVIYKTFVIFLISKSPRYSIDLPVTHFCTNFQIRRTNTQGLDTFGVFTFFQIDTTFSNTPYISANTTPTKVGLGIVFMGMSNNSLTKFGGVLTLRRVIDFSLLMFIFWCVGRLLYY
jgi:hypothetical protein